jgi:hypothetical protein
MTKLSSLAMMPPARVANVPAGHARHIVRTKDRVDGISLEEPVFHHRFRAAAIADCEVGDQTRSANSSVHVKAEGFQRSRDIVRRGNFLKTGFRVLVQMLTPTLQLRLQGAFHNAYPFSMAIWNVLSNRGFQPLSLTKPEASISTYL